MPPPATLRLLIAVGAALATLLVAGVAAMAHLASIRGDPSDSWRLRLLRLAAASPWQFRDLAVLLLLLATGHALGALRPANQAWPMATFHGAWIAGILALAARKDQPFGPRLPWRRVLGQSLLRWLAILPILWFSSFAWQLLLRAAGYAPDLQQAVLLFLEARTLLARVGFIFFAIVLAPFAEEVLFRGILLPCAVRRTGATAGLALTALAFAALHADLGTFVPLLLLSVALSLAYARTQSLWAPMAIHALFNAANLALLLALSRAGVVGT